MNSERDQTTQSQFDSLPIIVASQNVYEITKKHVVRFFLILLTVNGLLLSILCIGTLFPLPQFTVIDGGERCITIDYAQVALWFDHFAYAALFITGIFGAFIRHAVIRPFSIILIIATPFAWYASTIVISLTYAFCGDRFTF